MSEREFENEERPAGEEEIEGLDNADRAVLPGRDDASYLKAAAEALILAGSEPLTEKQFATALGKEPAVRLPELVRELNFEYERDSRGLEILAVAGGYQFFTRRDFSGLLRKLFAERARTRLSRAALETLAVVAYRSPVTRAEIDEIRGVDSGGVLRTLLDRRLVEVKGRAHVIGRPLLYETTPEFLKYFGLPDLADLPRETELLREWGQPRMTEEPAALPGTVEEETQSELAFTPETENGRLAIQPTGQTGSEEDTRP